MTELWKLFQLLGRRKASGNSWTSKPHSFNQLICMFNIHHHSSSEKSHEIVMYTWKLSCIARLSKFSVITFHIISLQLIYLAFESLYHLFCACFLRLEVEHFQSRPAHSELIKSPTTTIYRPGITITFAYHFTTFTPHPLTFHTSPSAPLNQWVTVLKQRRSMT
jgi:hypothetical protein